MNILYIQQDTCLYGASQSLLELLHMLKSLGHTVLILLPDKGELITELNRSGFDYRIVSWRTWTCTENTPWLRRVAGALRDLIYNHKLLSKIVEEIKTFNPDIIHTNSSKTIFGALLARRLRVPHVWHFREFMGGAYSCGLEFRLGKLLSKTIVSYLANDIVLISNVLNDHFGSVHKKCTKNVVYNGIMDLERMKEIDPALPSSLENLFTVALVGRLDDLKQPMVAFESICILVARGFNIRLLVAGDGDPVYVANLKRHVKENNLLQHIEIFGKVRDLSIVYRNCHVLAMPSRGEAFGRVTAEAMAYGRPVIGAEAGATKELIIDGENGLLFPVGDAQALANCMELLINDRNKLERLAANARATALRNFTTEKYAESILNIYRKNLKF